MFAIRNVYFSQAANNIARLILVRCALIRSCVVVWRVERPFLFTLKLVVRKILSAPNKLHRRAMNWIVFQAVLLTHIYRNVYKFTLMTLLIRFMSATWHIIQVMSSSQLHTQTPYCQTMGLGRPSRDRRHSWWRMNAITSWRNGLIPPSEYINTSVAGYHQAHSTSNTRSYTTDR